MCKIWRTNLANQFLHLLQRHRPVLAAPDLLAILVLQVNHQDLDVLDLRAYHQHHGLLRRLLVLLGQVNRYQEMDLATHIHIARIQHLVMFHTCNYSPGKTDKKRYAY